jgi:lipopolysaccharide export system ATP-binding protein
MFRGETSASLKTWRLLLKSSKTIEARGLVKIYRTRRVVDHIDVSIKAGEIAGLLGPNGAGKTTVFYMIAGLIKPDGGEVLLDETDITAMPLSARARAGISYLPQERSVFRGLTVEQNIDSVLEMLDISKVERMDRRERLLREFELEEVASSKGFELSGGEARRVEIARALAIGPYFMLLDEPFAGIDPIAVNTIQEIILRLKATGMGVLISDHNVRETLRVCDNAFILNEGQVLVSGTPEDISRSPVARAMYLGEDFRL